MVMQNKKYIQTRVVHVYAYADETRQKNHSDDEENQSDKNTHKLEWYTAYNDETRRKNQSDDEKN